MIYCNLDPVAMDSFRFPCIDDFVTGKITFSSLVTSSIRIMDPWMVETLTGNPLAGYSY